MKHRGGCAQRSPQKAGLCEDLQASHKQGRGADHIEHIPAKKAVESREVRIEKHTPMGFASVRRTVREQER